MTVEDERIDLTDFGNYHDCHSLMSKGIKVTARFEVCGLIISNCIPYCMKLKKKLENVELTGWGPMYHLNHPPGYRALFAGWKNGEYQKAIEFVKHIEMQMRSISIIMMTVWAWLLRNSEQYIETIEKEITSSHCNNFNISLDSVNSDIEIMGYLYESMMDNYSGKTHDCLIRLYSNKLSVGYIERPPVGDNSDCRYQIGQASIMCDRKKIDDSLKKYSDDSALDLLNAMCTHTFIKILKLLEGKCTDVEKDILNEVKNGIFRVILLRKFKDTIKYHLQSDFLSRIYNSIKLDD